MQNEGGLFTPSEFLDTGQSEAPGLVEISESLCETDGTWRYADQEKK